MIRSRWSGAHTFAMFAVLHAVAVLLGRATVLPGQQVSLVWPAAGVAVLWLMWTRRPVAVLVTLAIEQAVLMLATGASPVLAIAATLAALLQTWLVVAVLRRWVPGALGTGGEASIHSLPVLLRGTASVAIGCAAGALVGSAGLLLETGSLSWVDVALWFGRQLCGLMVVASVGHLTWERLTQPHRRPAAGAPELALLWTASRPCLRSALHPGAAPRLPRHPAVGVVRPALLDLRSRRARRRLRRCRGRRRPCSASGPFSQMDKRGSRRSSPRRTRSCC